MNEYYTELDKEKIIIGQGEKHLSASQLKNIPVFFIVGRPRSGTTLLRTLFDAHPNVIVPAECQLILNLYPKYGKITYWSKEQLEEFYHDLNKQWRFDVWPIDQKSLFRSLMACEGNNSYSTVCKVVYYEYRSIFGHNYLLALGDKNPGYTIYTPRLLKIFPEAKFIHIVRDYRDNYISIRNVDFELPIISVTTSKWRYFVKKFIKAAGKYPGTHLEIRYEDLVSQPEEQFRSLCEFVGIPYSSVPFDFYKKTGEAMRVYPKKLVLKYHSSLFHKINADKVGLWKNDLTPREVAVADHCAGKYAELTGHTRLNTRSGLAVSLRSLPGKLFAAILYFLTWIIDHLPYHMRMVILNKAPLVIGRLYLSIFNREKLRELDKRMASIGDDPKTGTEQEAKWKPAFTRKQQA